MVVAEVVLTVTFHLKEAVVAAIVVVVVALVGVSGAGFLHPLAEFPPRVSLLLTTTPPLSLRQLLPS